MAKKLILDVDTGTDDAVALMAAALASDLELIAATSVIGNVPGRFCTENSLRTFDYIGANIPVYPGMMEFMVRPDFKRVNPDGTHGSSVHGADYLDLPPAHTKVQEKHAVDFLIETYLASDGDITLMPVGPLTNIAMAVRREPRIVEKIPEMIIMGGAHHIGNRSASAEFNIWADPEAAKVVFACGAPMRIVPLDVTHRALVSLEDCKRLRALGTPAGEAAAIFIERRIEGYSRWQPMSRPDTAPVHDVLCVFALMDPSIIETEHIFVDVETKGELTDGRTVCDFGKRSGKEPNAHWAVNVDEAKFIDMLVDTLGRRIGE